MIYVEENGPVAHFFALGPKVILLRCQIESAFAVEAIQQPPAKEQGREGLRCIDLPGSTNSEPKVTLNVFIKLRRCFQIHISNISLILTDTGAGAGGQIVLLSEASLRRILPARRVKKRLIELCSDNNILKGLIRN